jgi:hypothetical protein
VTGVHLATLSTALWLVATVSLFLLLAHWSAGESWGLTASIVRGVRGWSDRDGRPRAIRSPSSEPFRPILDPYTLLRRDTHPFEVSNLPTDVPDVEIVELWDRPVARR